MKRRPLIAGNWKMNKTPRETEEFIERLLPLTGAFSGCDILLIPSHTSLDRAGRLLASSRVSLGAQDMHFEGSGAYTGATSAGMLTACGCQFVLVGHSERRHLFLDSDETVNWKLHASLADGLRPILCVGETLDQRRAGRMESILANQLDCGLKDVDEAALTHVVIAYEPVWAIGTGETATPKQAQEAVAFLRTWIETRFSKRVSEAMRILYGGSVKPENARSLQAQPDIDGALIGGAALDPDSFAQIITEAMSSQGDSDSC